MSGFEKRKKLSGFAFRQQKKVRQGEYQQLSNSLSQFLSRGEGSKTSSSGSNVNDPSAESLPTPTEIPKPVTEGSEASSVELEIPTPSIPHESDESIADNSSICVLSSSALVKILPFNKSTPTEINFCETEEPIIDLDPGNWPAVIHDSTRVYLVRKGPIEIKEDENFKYPKNNNNRCFNLNMTVRKLENGEKFKRSWLVYSKKCDAVFCFCCKLFKNDESSNLITVGYSNWKNAHKRLKEHEASGSHLLAFSKWMELSRRLKSNTTIDCTHQRILQQEIKYWQTVFQRLTAIITFLGQQCLAFRGTSDKLFEKNNGNFLKMVEFLSQFDAVMGEHVRRIQNEETHNHYLSKDIQNELIDILANEVQKGIVKQQRKAKYYSIISDCTRDVSKVEQMTTILRFILIGDDKKVEICEYFFGFKNVCKTTGEGLTSNILNILEENDIPLCDMRGQGYDNGSNMIGKHQGVQKRILDLNPRAFFVPCYSHRLNLIVNDIAKESIHAVKNFDVIQGIYKFLSGSSQRWDILKKNLGEKQKHLTVKPLSETRWESRIDAIRPFRFNGGLIYDTLFEISQSKDFDRETSYEAGVLAKKMQCFEFCVFITMWYNILSQINIASKILQNIDTNIAEAVDILKSVLDYLKNYRSEDKFEETLNEAQSIANDLDIDEQQQQFPQSTSVLFRPRRKSRFFDYEALDQPILDSKTKFRAECFFLILDRAISSIQERFHQLNHHNNIFDFLYNIASCKNYEKPELLKKCTDLGKALAVNGECDIDSLELFEEILFLREVVKPEAKPFQVLEYIARNDFATPNASVALRIMLTLPVTVASGERSFSKLKIIKNYLRSTMHQDRLSNLAVLAIENELVKKIDLNVALEVFAQKKARKVKFTN
jgi:hypothetical protein